jgi:L-ribulose-5-phosphate 3-epimerase
MQGRLLPKYKGRYQAHPVGYWENEFRIAGGLGLNCIEFIFDYNDFEINPLWSTEGRNKILEVTKLTGVRVYSVCADFFMECPLHSIIEEERSFSKNILIELIQNCNELEIKDIVIPCVDQSSLASLQCIERFKEQLHEVTPVAQNLGIRLSLETDLPPLPFKELLNELNSKSVTVNYDTGNSASLGYDFREELECYGDRISDLHIKDRVLDGGSVFLGTGDVSLSDFLREFEKYEFKGPIIMQLCRDDEGITIFKEQFEVFNRLKTSV